MVLDEMNCTEMHHQVIHFMPLCRQVTECVLLCHQVTECVLLYHQVTECVVRGLHDERVEVREMAVQVFSGLLHCGFIDRARQQELRVMTAYCSTQPVTGHSVDGLKTALNPA